MANESKYYPKIKKWVKDSYPNSKVYRISDNFRVGIPDFVISADGLFIGIEVKDETTKLRGIQVVELKEICESGGLGFVIRADKMYHVNAGEDTAFEWKTRLFKEVVNEYR